VNQPVKWNVIIVLKVAHILLKSEAMPHLKKAEEASIIMIGSAAGGRPMGSSIPYSVSE